MNDLPLTLSTLHDHIWQTLSEGVAHRHAPARNVALATVAPTGDAPELRTVILRAADKPSATLDFHTDLRSAKVAALRLRPLAEALVWDPVARLQIRLSGPVSILTGPSVTDAWNRVPEPARISYGNLPGPGEPIPDALAYTSGTGDAVFAVLRMSVTQIDALHLGDRHRRAHFRKVDNWQGEWLSP